MNAHPTARTDWAPWAPRPNAYAVSELSPEQARAVALVSMQEACAEITQACADLARLGCLVLSAHAIPGRPKVVVMPPPERSGLLGFMRRRDPHDTVLATDLNGVQVEWRIPTRCHRRAVRS